MNQLTFSPPTFLFDEIIESQDSDIQKIFIKNGLVLIKSMESVSIKNLKKLSNKFGTIFSNSVSSIKDFFYKADKEIL